MFPGTVPVDPAAPLQVASCHLTRYKSWQLSLPLASGVSPSRGAFQTMYSRILRAVSMDPTPALYSISVSLTECALKPAFTVAYFGMPRLYDG